jgi:hypothetical protein
MKILLYNPDQRLEAAGRLTRPKHWQEFIAFAMAHTPEKISIEDAQKEVRIGGDRAYSPEAIEKAVDSLDYKPLGYGINILISRLCFRGIYFPQMGKLAWVKVIAQDRRTIFKLIKERFTGRLEAPLRVPSASMAAEASSAPATKH